MELNDREGLERLCRYGARPTFALERPERLPDSSLLYRFGRAMPGGQTIVSALGHNVLVANARKLALI